MPYIHGAVLPVPTANRDAYIAQSRGMAAIFREHGALRVVDCWGDDVPAGAVTSFPMAVQCAEDETVVFSWMVWPDRKTAEAGMEKAMADERMTHDMPFDTRRMIFGGFEVVVDV